MVSDTGEAYKGARAHLAVVCVSVVWERCECGIKGLGRTWPLMATAGARHMRLSRSLARAVRNDDGITGSAPAPAPAPTLVPVPALAPTLVPAMAVGLWPGPVAASCGNKARANGECAADSPVRNAAAICTSKRHICGVTVGE